MSVKACVKIRNGSLFNGYEPHIKRKEEGKRRGRNKRTTKDEGAAVSLSPSLSLSLFGHIHHKHTHTMVEWLKFFKGVKRRLLAEGG
jgi:hypothetical protein